MDLFALVLLFGLAGLFGVRAWKAQGRLAAPDRGALVTSFVAVVTTFLIARLLVNWVRTPPALWLAAVTLLAGGVLGAARRWPTLAWFSGAHPLRRAIGAGVTLVVSAVVIGLAVV